MEWNEITYTSPNFNGTTIEVLEWISNDDDVEDNRNEDEED